MNKRVTVRIETDIDEALQRLIASDLTTARSKQDAFRHIVRDWLIYKGYLAIDTLPEGSGAGASPHLFAGTVRDSSFD